MKQSSPGIERTRAKKTEEADRNISVAFADLSQLMVKAKEMVKLSQSVSQKIREKQGEISDDETVTFQAHLLSLGVADPVTRDSCAGGGDSYTLELAKQVTPGGPGLRVYLCVCVCAFTWV